MKCTDCFFRDYSERRFGKYAEQHVITWHCSVKSSRPLLLKLVKEKGVTIERFVADVTECEEYRQIAWKLEPFKRVME
jgi:hypothetical protein